MVVILTYTFLVVLGPPRVYKDIAGVFPVNLHPTEVWALEKTSSRDAEVCVKRGEPKRWVQHKKKQAFLKHPKSKLKKETVQYNTLPTYIFVYIYIDIYWYPSICHAKYHT